MGEVISRPARIETLDAIDFVGRPAANPNGLLSAGDGPEDKPADAPTENAEGDGNDADADDDTFDYLGVLAKKGAQYIAGFCANTRSQDFAKMRAKLTGLCADGYVRRGEAGLYSITPRGNVRYAYGRKK